MNKESWKARISRLPVVGNIVTGLIGVATLKVWRAAMRDDIRELRQRVEDAERRHAELLRHVDESQEHFRRQMEGRLDAAVRSQLEPLLRDGLRAVENKTLHQADRLAHLAQRVNACHAETAHLRRTVGALAAELRFPDDAPDAAPGDLPPVAPVREAPLADDAAAQQPYRHLFLPFANDGQARFLALHQYAPESWLMRLRREQAGSLAGITALAGAQALATPELQAVLDAGLRALRPDGILVIQYDNPENLLVASALLQAEPPCHPVSPARAQRLVRDAGFGECAIMRLQADDAAERLEGEGAAIERLNQLLCGPRVFAVVGRKAG